jgi:hypothetical protein
MNEANGGTREAFFKVIGFMLKAFLLAGVLAGGAYLYSKNAKRCVLCGSEPGVTIRLR